MDSDQIAVVALAAIICGTVLVAVMVQAVLHYKAKTRQPVAPPQSPAIEERLRRIEQAVDSVAIEVERIAEGQRFTAKLLAERSREPEGRG